MAVTSAYFFISLLQAASRSYTLPFFMKIVKIGPRGRPQEISISTNVESTRTNVTSTGNTFNRPSRASRPQKVLSHQQPTTGTLLENIFILVNAAHINAIRSWPGVHCPSGAESQPQSLRLVHERVIRCLDSILSRQHTQGSPDDFRRCLTLNSILTT